MYKVTMSGMVGVSILKMKMNRQMLEKGYDDVQISPWGQHCLAYHEANRLWQGVGCNFIWCESNNGNQSRIKV